MYKLSKVYGPSPSSRSKVRQRRPESVVLIQDMRQVKGSQSKGLSSADTICRPISTRGSPESKWPQSHLSRSGVFVRQRAKRARKTSPHTHSSGGCFLVFHMVLSSIPPARETSFMLLPRVCATTFTVFVCRGTSFVMASFLGHTTRGGKYRRS